MGLHAWMVPRDQAGDTSPRITIRKIERVISGHRVKWTTLYKREQRMSPPSVVVARTHSYGNPLAWTEDRKSGRYPVRDRAVWYHVLSVVKAQGNFTSSHFDIKEFFPIPRIFKSMFFDFTKLSPATSSSSPWLLHLPVILNSYFCILLSFACAGKWLVKAFTLLPIIAEEEEVVVQRSLLDAINERSRRHDPFFPFFFIFVAQPRYWL